MYVGPHLFCFFLISGEDIIGNMELYRRYSDNVNRRRRHVTLTDLHSRNKRQATSSSIDWGDDEDDEDLSVHYFFYSKY